MKDKRYVFINADGSIDKITEKEPSLAEKQAHVGGLIEYAVVTTDKKFALPFPPQKAILTDVRDVIVNEEGRLLGMHDNPIASYAAYGVALDDPNQLCGPAIVVCDEPDETCEIVELDWLIQAMVPESMWDFTRMLHAQDKKDFEAEHLLVKRASYGEEE